MQHPRCLTRSVEKIITSDVPATQFLTQPGRLLAFVVGWLKVTLIPSAFSKPTLTQASSFLLSMEITPIAEASSTPHPHFTLLHNKAGRRPSTGHGPGLTQKQGEEASFLVARNKFSKFPGLAKKHFYSKCFTMKAFIKASKKLQVVDENLPSSYTITRIQHLKFSTSPK